MHIQIIYAHTCSRISGSGSSGASTPSSTDRSAIAYGQKKTKCEVDAWGVITISRGSFKRLGYNPNPAGIYRYTACE